MKSLLIVRHAKSSWDFSGTSDFDRPLNARGKADAPEMAGRLKNEKIVPNLLVSSSARRARKTAQLFGQVFSIEKQDILLVDELYEASSAVFSTVVSGLSNNFNCVAIFSHNPGITEFVNSLTTTRIDDMPTCGVFAIKISLERWEDFSVAEKSFWFFNSPKLQF